MKCIRCGAKEDAYWKIGGVIFCKRCHSKIKPLIKLWLDGEFNVLLGDMNCWSLICDLVSDKPRISRRIITLRSRERESRIQVIVQLLKETPSMTMKEIASATVYSMCTARLYLLSLISQGLVRRTRLAEDKRVFIYSLTEEDEDET